MKKFFILKDEFFTIKENVKLPPFICDERTLRQAVNGNTISKYRSIPCFKEGSLVRLRDDRGLIWNEDMVEDHCSQIVTMTSVGKLIDFEENHGSWSFYVDSVAEIIQY